MHVEVVQLFADGDWVRVQGAVDEHLSRPSGRRFDLICAAYELSVRERELVALLMVGLDTTTLTNMLVISRHTVQDHLKSIFAKVGVRSRRELMARLMAGTVTSTEHSEDRLLPVPARHRERPIAVHGAARTKPGHERASPPARNVQHR